MLTCLAGSRFHYIEIKKVSKRLVPMGVVVGTVSVKAQEVLLFWDVAFFRAR